MAHIAIIPARGGSKRLPGKNIKLLGGKPLIAWTIEAALKSDCFDQVIVSTDDQDISSVAKEFGASVPFIRPAELSGDTATSDAVIKHAVEWLENTENLVVETVTLLQPTSPFRNSQHICESFKVYLDKQADAVVSVTKTDTRLELCNTLPTDHSLVGFLKGDMKRTQDMQQVYELNGAIYLFKRNFVGVLGKVYSAECRGFAYVMSPDDSVDIDTVRDFQWAEFLLNSRARASDVQ